MRNHLRSVAISLVLACLPVQMMVCEFASAQTTSDRKMEADRLLKKGDQLYQGGQYLDALQVWGKSLQIYREIKSLNGEGASLYNIGVTYELLKDYQRSIIFYKQSLTIAIQIDNEQAQFRVLNNLGDLYDNSLQQYQNGIEYYQKALAIANRIRDYNSEATLLSKLGKLHNIIGKYQNAIEYYQQAVTIAKRIGDRYIEKDSLIGLTKVYKALGQYEKALGYNVQALTILITTPNVSDRDKYGDFVNDLSETYSDLAKIIKVDNTGSSSNKLDSTDTRLLKLQIPLLQIALASKRKTSDFYGESLILSNLGDIYNLLEQYEKAIEYYQQSLSIARQIGDRNGEANSFNNLGTLFAKLNQPELAIVFYKASVNVRETIRKDIRGLSKEEKKSYLNTIAQTYRNLADLLLKQGRILEAQQVLELLKVEEIRAYTRNTRAIDDTNGIATNKTETKTIDEHNSLIALGLRLDECEQKKCPELSQLIQQRDRIATEYQQTAKLLIKEIRDRKTNDDQFFDPRKVTKMNEIVSAQPNTVLIYPLILKDKIWILWAAKGGITKSFEVSNIGLEKVSSNVLKLRTLLQSPENLAELQQTSQQLYNWLIPPELQAELKANKIEHLIFAPDSVTRYIPMGVLFDGKQYLIENYTIATIISADLTNTTARLPTSAQNTSILAAGLSQSVAGYSPLPNVLSEINAIVRTASDPSKGIYNGIKLLDRSFTKESLRDNLGSYAIAHIATHGKFVSGDADKSFLVLGDGKELPIPEIEKFRGLEKLHLVVLSACQTALGGSNGDGTEIAGISYYFLNTGAKAVIASLWEVSDDSTSLLMQQFYNNLAKSSTSAPITKAEAMRQAQLSLLQKQITVKDSLQRGASVRVVYREGGKPSDNYSHPYYWSPFILIGNGW